MHDSATLSYNKLSLTLCPTIVPVCSGRLGGLAVTRPAWRAAGRGTLPALPCQASSGVLISTTVAALPGARCDRVSARTGWPGVSTLRLAEIAGMICIFHVSVATCGIVEADPFLGYAAYVCRDQGTKPLSVGLLCPAVGGCAELRVEQVLCHMSFLQ